MPRTRRLTPTSSTWEHGPRTNPTPGNPMLSLVIWNTLRNVQDVSACLTEVTVHAWYEGHISAHMAAGHTIKLSPNTSHFDPPYPDAEGDEWKRVVKETRLRLGQAPKEAQVAMAAGLAWAAGYEEGQKCKGDCKPQGSHDEMAADIRSGRCELRVEHI